MIKVSDASELGKNIVVQGGTFYNDAVLRSFEKIAGCKAIRPDIAGIMGAFGAALIAREHYEDGYVTTMLDYQKICDLQFETSMAKCKGLLLPIMPVSLWRTTANKGKKILKSLPVRYLHGN